MRPCSFGRGPSKLDPNGSLANILFPKLKSIEDTIASPIIIKPSSQSNIRISPLSLPSSRQLIALWQYATNSKNVKLVKYVEKLLCTKLNQSLDFVKKYIAKNRPRKAIDPDKFTKDDLDHPVFFIVYKLYRYTKEIKRLVYNFRGIPNPPRQKALRYIATKRILMLAEPKKYISDDNL